MRQFDKAAAAADVLLAQDRTDLKAAYLKVTILEGRRDFAGAVAAPRAAPGPAAHRRARRRFRWQRSRLPRPSRLRLPAARALPRGRGRLRARGGHRGDPDANLLGQYVDALVLAKDQAKALTQVRAARARFPEDPELAASEANVLRTGGRRGGRGGGHREAPRQRSPDNLGRAAGGGRLLPEGEALRGRRRRRCATPSPSSRATCARCSSSGAVLERMKRSDDGGGGVPPGPGHRARLRAGPELPRLHERRPRRARRGGRSPSSRRRWPSIPRTAPISTAWAGRCSASTAPTRPSSSCAAPSTSRARTPSCSTTSATSCAAAGRTREAVEFWRKALTAEDDGEDLDRAGVERKIREAQASLNDAAQVKRP